MRKSNTGSALMLVVISSLILIILTGAAYTYMRSSGRTQAWTRDRIQVKLTAESGANLAVHMILGGADIPQGKDPQWFLGDGLTWYDLPDPLGRVMVVVDPFDENVSVLSANAYEVRSLGRISSEGGFKTFAMSVAVMPENIARFSVFYDRPGTNVFIGDGMKFDGPFYANGPVILGSAGPGSENDPYFYSFTLTSDFYYYGTNTNYEVADPYPIYKNLTMQPINRHLMGEPWFELGADPIPFGSEELNWTSVRSAAISGGLFLGGPQIQHEMRMILRHDTLFVRRNSGALTDTYYLGDLTNNVVWIENAPTDKYYLKSYGNMRHDGLSVPLTIGSYGSIVFGGNILYQNVDPTDPDNDIMLGLMTVHGEIDIADCRTANTGWPFEFTVSTINNVEVNAVLLALDGNIGGEYIDLPRPHKVLTIMGGYMVQRKDASARWYGGFDYSGHLFEVLFDPRMMTMHPPFFPNNGRWHVLYWAEEPNLELGAMMINRR